MRHLMAVFVTVAVLVLCFSAVAQQGVISTYIGGGPNNIPAVDADINAPEQVVLDSAGNFYYSDFNNNRVFKVNASTGIVTVVAGLGTPGYSGDGGPAPSAQLDSPIGVAVDGSGNVYIADTGNQVIRKVNTNGVISTVAGTGTCTYDGDTTGPNGDGKPATEHSLCNPYQLAIDPTGNLFIADSSNNRIRELSGTSISTVAGNGTGTACADGTLAIQCGFGSPQGIAVDSSDNLYISDTNDYVIREVTASSGEIITIAGTLGTPGFSGDGGPATLATLYVPVGVAVNSAGTTVWIADQSNFRIRSFTVGGNIATVAGGGSGGESGYACGDHKNRACNAAGGGGNVYFCGDGGPATTACLYYPAGVAVDGAGNFFIADYDNYRIRKVDTSGNINTVAGNGGTTQETLINNVPSNGVTLNYPWGLVGDPSGNLFIADQCNYVVREFVDSSDLMTLLAGDGTQGYSGDGGPAATAELGYPYDVARDNAGNAYIADTYNCVVRKVDTARNISSVAGTPGSCGFAGDGGPAASAYLDYPEGVYVDGDNNLYIADTYNNVIRKVSGGIITTVAGTPTALGYSGDGGPATSAELYYPSGVKADSTGTLYVADTYNHRVRMVNASSGNITTIAGNGNGGFSGDGIATQNSLYYPSNIWRDPNDNLFIADQYNNRVRMVDPAGLMTTVAGSGTASLNGDGGPAINASLYLPADIYEDVSGDLFIADQYNYRIRKVNAFAAVGRSTANVTFGTSPVGTTVGPEVVTLSGVGPAAISSLSASGDFGEVDNCAGNLPNGSTCTVDVYFKPSASGTRTGTLTINSNGYFTSTSIVGLAGTGSDFSLASSPESATIKAGTTATYILTVAPVGGPFANAIKLNCGGAPVGATCSLSPTSVTPGPNPATVTLTITTTASVAAATQFRSAQTQPVYAAWMQLQGLGLFGMLVAGSKRWTKKFSMPIVLAMLIAVLLFMAACGGLGPAPQNPPGTTPGTYTITVNGSSGALQHSVTVTLTVQ